MFTRLKSFLFENQNLRQTVAKNTFWLSVSNIGGRLIRALIVIYAARILGAAGWGIFSYAVSLAAFLAIIADSGINYILVREIAKNSDAGRRIKLLSTSFFLKIVFLVLGAGIIVFVIPRFVSIQEAKAILPVIALIFGFDAIREFGFTIFRASEKMERETKFFILTNAAIAIFGFIFLLVTPTVKAFAYSYALGTGIGSIATIIALRKNLNGLLVNFSRPLVKFILFSSWPYAIGGLLGVVLLNIDVLLIGWLRSVEEIGFYSAAKRILDLLYVLPAILATSALPVFSRLANQDDLRMRRVLEQVIKLSLAMAIPLALGGLIVGPQMIGFIYGEAYLAAALPFQILLPTLIILYPAIILTNAILAYNRQGILIIYMGIAVFLTVALDILLIPRWGIAGSATATLIGHIASNIYLWRTIKSLNYFRVIPLLAKIIAASILMSLIAFGLTMVKMPFLGVVIMAGAAYVGFLYLLKEPLFKEAKLLFGTDSRLMTHD